MGVNLTYAIQTERRDQDQTLMECFLQNFTSIKGSKGLSIRYGKKIPERLKSKSMDLKPDKGIFFIEINVPRACLSSDSSKEQILTLHQTLHMHMKSTKNCLNLENSRYLKDWERRYNRCLD